MQLKKILRITSSAMFPLLFHPSIFAAVLSGSNLPSSTLPENVSKYLSTPLPTPTGTASPVTEKQEIGAPNLAEEAKKIKFQLNGIILEGNTVYNDKQLSAMYQNKLKKIISIADLFKMVQEITNYYRNNGYIISRAILPPQHVKNGIVHIKIIEGYIGDIIVAGNYKGAKCLVQAFGNQIKKCPPLHISQLETYLLYANEIPATQVKAVLAPSKNKIGAADLTLVTENKPVTGYVSYDNYGTRYIGPQQMTANLALNSFIASGDSSQFSISKTPKGNELTFVDINYNMPVNDHGMRWLIGGTRANTQPLFVLRPAHISGLTDNYYTTLSLPWIRTRSKSLTFQATLNYNDSEVTTLDELLYQDHVRGLDLGVTYNFADAWSGMNLIVGDFKQGLPILGYTSNTNPDTALTSHPGGRGDFTKIVLQMSRLQLIKGAFSAYGLMRGQWAFNPLLASEQFSFGGNQLGRGYDVSEIIGDKGLAASLELRYDWPVNRFFIQGFQLYTFYDAGMIWNFKQLVGSPGQKSATSAGLGSRFYLTKYISGNVMWTQNLTKPVDAEQIIGRGDRPRLFFSVIANY